MRYNRLSSHDAVVGDVELASKAADSAVVGVAKNGRTAMHPIAWPSFVWLAFAFAPPSEEVDVEDSGSDSSGDAYANHTAPPLSAAYFPGSVANSPSKFWKSRLMGSDWAYARKSRPTSCLSSGKTAGRMCTLDLAICACSEVLCSALR